MVGRKVYGGQIVMQSIDRHHGPATLFLQPFTLVIVSCDDYIGVVKSGNLLANGKTTTAKGSEVMDDGNNFCSSSMGCATNQRKVFLDGVL